MDRPPEDDRSLLATAYSWATTVMVIAFEMVVPGLIGLWLGKMLGVVPMIVLASLGFLLGLFVAIRTLIKIAASKSKTNQN